MQKVINAIFGGKVLHSENPIKIEQNTRVRLTIEPFGKSDKKKRSFLQTAKSLKIDGPSDWSGKFEEYLYGKDKKLRGHN